MSKQVTDEQLTADEREFIKGKPYPAWVGRVIGCIGFAVFAIPFTAHNLIKLGHDVPEGYSYLTKSTKGVYYYAKLGGKFESVQVMNIHSIDGEKKAEAFPVPVDCNTGEAGGKTPKAGTVASKIVARAC